MMIGTAQAGSLESSDCMVIVSPAGSFSLDYRGPNSRLFGGRTEAIAREMADRYAPEGAEVRIQDRGALEITLRARIETAFKRAADRKS